MNEMSCYYGGYCALRAGSLIPADCEPDGCPENAATEGEARALWAHQEYPSADTRRAYVQVRVNQLMRRIKAARGWEVYYRRAWRHILAHRAYREAGVPIPEELRPF